MPLFCGVVPFEMGEVREYESEQEFIEDTRKRFGTFHRIDSEERFLTDLIPHQRDLDIMVYDPYIRDFKIGDYGLPTVGREAFGTGTRQRVLP